MNSRMNIYFMTLVGALAGLTSWTVVMVLVRAFPAFGQSRFLDALNMSLLGMFICGLAVGFADYWSEGQLLPLWIATGSLLGLMVGLVGGLAAITIHSALGVSLPTGSRLIPWTLAGGLIGFGAGLRWLGISFYRPLISMLGGMLGAAVGGAIFTISGKVFSEATDFVQATAFVITGVGISTGVTLAPALLSDKLIRFLTSTDSKTMQQCARSEWLLNDNDRLLVGSLSMHQTSSWYGPEVGIFLPDPSVARRHAYLSGHKGHYFIEDADETSVAQGRFGKVLEVNHQPIRGRHELRNGDLITVGSTQLQFEVRARTGGA